MVYLRVLGLAGLFLICFARALIARLIGRPLHDAWTLLQETVVRLMRSMARRVMSVDAATLRQRLDELASLARIRPGKILREPAELEAVPAEWLEPPGLERGAPVILYLHGGGYIMCSTVTHRLLMLRLARAARARVLGLNYRLAPEHRLPAAVDDAVAAYRWLLGQGHDPARICLAGDSAGGGLALAALLRLRDEGTPLPAGAALISPWVDMDADDDSLELYAGVDYAGTGREGFRRMSSHYLGDADPRDPLASPLRGDLSGLPPLLLHAGGVEVLRGQVERLAARAQGQGVRVSLSVYPGMVHVWHAFPQVFPQARTAMAEIGAFVRERTEAQDQG